MGEAKRRAAAEAEMMKADQEAMERFVSTPQGAAMLAAQEALTAPDKEDWTVLVNGDRVCMTCFQEDQERRVHSISGEVPLAELKKEIPKFPVGRLGCVSLIFPTDAEKYGAVKFLSWLQPFARKKKFNITFTGGQVPTAQAVQAWRDMTLARAAAAGEA
jgi:hypothetical protein